MNGDKNCECVIGMMNNYDDSKLFAFADLKEYIESLNHMSILYGREIKYTLNDYCDRRRSTSLKQFNYCPFCGKEIDWKAIRRGD